MSAQEAPGSTVFVLSPFLASRLSEEIEKLGNDAPLPLKQLWGMLNPSQDEHFAAAHARRYLEAVYGSDVAFRAPETFPNLLERWLLGVAGGNEAYAEEQLALIERMCGARQGHHEEKP